MERRNVIKLFPWVFSVFGLGVAQAGIFRQNTLTTKKSDTFYFLKNSEVFILPKNPNVGDSIVFVNQDNDWGKNPATIKSTTFSINGLANEDLLVDINHTFGLQYLGKTAGWQYFKA